MKVSIITATYNSEATIEGCIKSVLSQDYPNIEYIIIDGNSSDYTLSVVNAYKQRYSDIIVISEPDNGIYDALNKGIKVATGDIVGFLHSDDFFNSENTIKNIVKEFSKGKVEGVYGNLDYVNSKDSNKIVRHWKSLPFTKKLLNRGWMPAHPTVFLKKEVYDKLGLFNTKFKIAADYDMMLRVFSDESLRFKFLPEVITKMRVGGASNRSLKNIITKSNEDYIALKRNHLDYPLWSLVLKNFSKIPQFFRKS
ncbi:glycosyltransferase family 2 protein [Mangrovimonas sp. DI 80]|uniref:glycosyltransferase family 2 protein n=1 Tax=Mangrovimonas sp. DI 80 TaxID=1779330 RepID=UPI0009756A22|nr:glycosyltransferase family 2 protein [Mangrovimonas sp. DI 80]OMP31770.1 glycosyl transferase [Mangrovimonas sp. DI 80]